MSRETNDRRSVCTIVTCSVVLLAAAGVLLPRAARADLFTWDNSGGGLYGTAGNWDPSTGGGPDSGDIADFNMGSQTYTVTFDSAEQSDQALIRGGDIATWDLSGYTYTLNNGGDALGIGYISGTGNGTLTITDGTVAGSGYIHVGDSSTNTGTLTLSNSGGNIAQVGASGARFAEINVGRSGTGTMTISGGSDLYTTIGNVGREGTATGVATVDGGGSLWDNSSDMFIGRVGDGTLTVQNGGDVAVGSNAFIGYDPNGQGQLTVQGSGSTFESTGYLQVGRNPADLGSTPGGRMDVLSGGVVTTGGDAVVGEFSTKYGAVYVDGTDSLWDINGGSGLFLGNNGKGYLEISGGGEVQSALAWIGRFSTGDGEANVTGDGSLWDNTGSFYVGFAGSGAVTVADGGDVDVSGAETILAVEANTSYGELTVTGDGSTFTTSAPLKVGLRDGTGDAGIDAQLNVLNGGVVTVNNFAVIGELADSKGDVDVTGANSTLDVNSGLQVGGSGSGDLDVTGGGDVDCTDFFLGRQAGSVGSVTVNNSTLDASGNMWYGSFGSTGTLDVEAGGDATGAASIVGGGGSWSGNAGGIGTVTIDGSGSTLTNDNMWIGRDGTGTVTVTNDGHLQVNGFLGIANDNAAGVGTLKVQNGGTLTVTGILEASTDGTATLEIDSDAVVTTEGLFLESGSTFTFKDGTLNINGSFDNDSQNLLLNGDGAGDLPTLKMMDASTTSNLNNLTVGGTNSAALEVREGSTMSVAQLNVALGSATSNSTITVNNGTITTSGDMLVGWKGTGTLNVENGGTVTTSGNNAIGGGGAWDAAANGTGQVTVTGTGSSLTTGPDLWLGKSGTGTVTVDQSAHLQVNGDVNIADDTDADAGAGTLKVQNGATATVTGTLTNSALGTATLEIDSDATVTAENLVLETGSAFIFRDGTLNINGSFDNDSQNLVLTGDATGDEPTLKMLDASTSTGVAGLTVGYAQAGRLEVREGSTFSNSGFASVGGEATGPGGSVLVDGSGSHWNSSGDMAIGHVATGSLTVQNSGQVTAPKLVIGQTGASADGTVTVDNSTLTTGTGDIIVGFNGIGVLNVQAGSTVTSGAGLLGGYKDGGSDYGLGDGTATVTGTGSSWTASGNMTIGINSSGTSTLIVEDNAVVTVTGTTTIDHLTYPGAGALEIKTGGTYNATGAVANAGQINFTSGTGTLNGGGAVTNTGSIQVSTGATAEIHNDVAQSGTFSVASGGTANLYGTLSGGGATGTGLVTVRSGGSLSPGASPGTMSFAGDVTWYNGGSYLWEINDVDAGAGSDPGWDLITVSGTLDLSNLTTGGYALNITSQTLAGVGGNVHDFNPTNDYTWSIVQAGGITGFSAGNFALDASAFTNSTAGVFAIRQTGNDLELTYTTPPDGTVTNVYSFAGGAAGESPGQSPVLHDGKLYGVTTYGGVGPEWGTGAGSGGWGVLYRLNDNGTGYEVLHNFSGTEEGPTGQGRRPQGFTVDTTNNVIYGVTQYTSRYDLGGTLYKINTDGTGFDVLHSFAGGNDDGKYPYSVLQAGTMLYGVTRYGGDSDKGTVFSYDTVGESLSLLHEFTGSGGAEPLGRLTLDGTTLYGVTYAGGTSGAGTLFQITNLDTTPTFLTLKNFDDLGTMHPYDAPVVVVDGTTVSLYGTAAGEWATDDGVVWSYIFDTGTPTGGVFTSLIEFDDEAGGNPMGGLVLGEDRGAGQYLFGATAGTKLWGGDEYATLFALLLDGSGFLTQETFDQAGDPDAITRTPFFIDPADPHMVQMYGTSHSGGAYGFGTVWYFEAPEPATMLLLATGGCLVLVRRRRRR